MNKLDPVSFDKLLATQNPLTPPHGAFDLTGVELITSAALVQLVAACHTIALQGRQATITVTDEGVRRYLVRSGFAEAIKGVARIDPPVTDDHSNHKSFRRGGSRVLIEVTKFESESVISDLLNRIIEILRSQLNFRKYDAFDVACAVSEICGNVTDHARQGCGFIAMQVYYPRETGFVEVGVADYGEGIAATLRNNSKLPTITNDFQAIRLAVQEGISEHDSPNRGIGLYHLLCIAKKLGGLVQIRSGSAKLRYREGEYWDRGMRVPLMPGVQIAFTLQTKLAVNGTIDE